MSIKMFLTDAAPVNALPLLPFPAWKLCVRPKSNSFRPETRTANRSTTKTDAARSGRPANRNPDPVSDRWIVQSEFAPPSDSFLRPITVASRSPMDAVRPEWNASKINKLLL